MLRIPWPMLGFRPDSRWDRRPPALDAGKMPAIRGGWGRYGGHCVTSVNKLPFFPTLEWIQNFHPELGKIIDVAGHDGQSMNHGGRRD